MDMNVEKFSEKILAIHEPDYGDFMRKANHYLLDLKKALVRLPNQEVKNKLDQMQNYIQFHPNWEIEPTVIQILKDINEIDKMLFVTH